MNRKKDVNKTYAKWVGFLAGFPSGSDEQLTFGLI